jgi:hypothetical protein
MPEPLFHLPVWLSWAGLFYGLFGLGVYIAWLFGGTEPEDYDGPDDRDSGFEF